MIDFVCRETKGEKVKKVITPQEYIGDFALLTGQA